MVLFATPDFGAGAAVAFVILVAWVVALGGSAFAWLRGRKLLAHDSPKARRAGIIFTVAAALIPLSCCFGPSLVVRIVYGNFPVGIYSISRICKGMTRDEVVARLGTPHYQSPSGTWIYWMDSFGIDYFVIDFGDDGTVVHTGRN